MKIIECGKYCLTKDMIQCLQFSFVFMRLDDFVFLFFPFFIFNKSEASLRILQLWRILFLSDTAF